MSQSQATAQISKTEQGLQLSGDLVYASVSNVVAEASDILKNHAGSSISIDCKNLNKIDSAGLALLLEWKRVCIKQKKDYKVVGAKEKAVSLISTYKLSEILGVPSSSK